MPLTVSTFAAFFPQAHLLLFGFLYSPDSEQSADPPLTAYNI